VQASVPKRLPEESVDSYLQRLEAWLVENFERSSGTASNITVNAAQPIEGTLGYFTKPPVAGGVAGWYMFRQGQWVKV